MPVRYRIALLLAIITTINYVDRATFGVVAPVVRKLFDIGDQDYGLLTSGFLFAYGIGQLISGPLIDRFGTKSSFGIAAALWSLSTMLHAFGRGVWSFLALRVSLGLTEAANFPVATKAISQWFPASERSTGVSIFMLGAGLGAIIAPPSAIWIMESFGWRWAFIVPGALGLLWVIVWQRTYYLPEHHPRIDPKEKALILRERSEQIGEESWTALLRHKEFWGLLVARSVSDFPFYFFLFWLPQYLTDDRGFDLKSIAMFAWIPFVAADIGALTGGWLSSRLIKSGRTIDYSRKAVIWLGAILVLAAMPVTIAQSTYIAMALICFAMFSIQIKGSVFFTLPSDLFPAARVATVWGIFGAVGSVGASFFGYLSGWIIQTHGYGPVFVMISLMHILSAFILMIMVPRIRQLATVVH